jgi:HSP20 family molecular chaperone IbpA
MIQTITIEELINELPHFFKEETLMTSPNLKNRPNTLNYDITSGKDKIIFKTTAVGLCKNEITMSISRKHLKVKSKDTNPSSKFKTTLAHNIYIGENIDKEKVTASLENGILTIDMPIKESKKDFLISF